MTAADAIELTIGCLFLGLLVAGVGCLLAALLVGAGL